jgi:murein L,D-transpeptidase YafK
MGPTTPPAFLFLLLLLFFSLLHSGCATNPPAQIAQVPTEPPCGPREEEDLDPGLPVTAPLKAPKIVIKKAKKKLLLYSEEKLLRTYPVKLGFNPVGDKVRQGDKRTPEGSYYICMKNPRSKYYLSLGLSYPSIEDAERGLEQKLITKNDRDRIIERISKKSIPPWDTPLGGEIFIHGGGETWDWTYGCVALRNKDIEELFKVIALGTEVIIQQ